MDVLGEGFVTVHGGGTKDDLTKLTLREEPLMWAGSVGMMEKGDWDLSVVMLKTGGGGLLDLMEWSGRLLLGRGGAVLLSCTLLLISSPEIRILRSELLKLVVGGRLTRSTW